MKRRVVITGLGAITPIGNTVEEFWNGIKNGTVGIGPITKFDTTEYKVKIAAEDKDFVAKERMDLKASKRMETFSQYAVAAAKEEWRDHRFRNWKPAADRETVHDNPGKGTGKGSTTDGSDDDFQYGSRKCIDSAWA